MRQIPPRYRPVVVAALRAGAARWTKAAMRPTLTDMTRISWEANARYLTDAANEVANPADEKERDLGRKDEPKLVALLRWITTTHRARTRAINNGPAPPNPPHNRVTMDEIIDKAAKLDIQMSSLELRGWWTEQSLNLLPKKIVTELEKTP